MVKVINQEIAPSDKIDYSHNLKFAQRFGHKAVRTRGFFNSRKRRKQLISQSPISTLAKDWLTLTDSEKSAWTVAAQKCNMVGYKLYTEDYALRLSNSRLPLSLPFNVWERGAVAPSIFWQGRVGHVQITDYADEYHVTEHHEMSYYVLRKVFNSRNSYEPILISENATVPIDLKFNYRSMLNNDSGEGFVLLLVTLRGGPPPNNALDFVFVWLDLTADWKEQLQRISSLPVGFEYYTLQFIFYGVSGDFWFDDFSIRHSGLEWSKDLKCERVNERFLNADYDFFPSWFAEEPRAGFGVDCVFPLSD